MKQKMNLIGITMGDASGVGPELVLKAARDRAIPAPYVVVGDFSILDFCNRLLKFGQSLRSIQSAADWEEGFINVLDQSLLEKEDLEIGTCSKASGWAAARYVEKAVDLARKGVIEAMVTLPMNKEATRLSDPGFTGHTELIARLCEIEDPVMLLAGEKFSVSHVSTHVSMAEAVLAVRYDRIGRVIELTEKALKRMLTKKPRLAVAGLNPHAGENGAFGQEEKNEIRPAVLSAKAQGIDCEGPIPPDTVFLHAVQGTYDAVVCMYHDQGHIPMKLLDFEGAVNVTLGLDIIRTSVDHGTAFDIAYQNKASIQSFIHACRLAVKLAHTEKSEESKKHADG